MKLDFDYTGFPIHAIEKVMDIQNRIHWYKYRLLKVKIMHWQNTHGPIMRRIRRESIKDTIKHIRALEWSVECWRKQ